MFNSTTLTEAESWKLAELMEQFSVLKVSAEVFGRGGTHITTIKGKHTIKKENWAKEINEILLPRVFKEIDNLFKGVI